MSFAFGAIASPLNFGSVPRSRLKYLPLTVSGTSSVATNVTITATSNNTLLFNPEAAFGWAAAGTGAVSKSFTLGAGQQLSDELQVSFKSPASGSPSAQLTFTCNVAGTAPATVTLQGQVGAPTAIAVSFIVDHSQNMSNNLGGSPRINIAHQAAQACLDQMLPTDSAELIQFSNVPTLTVSNGSLGPQGGGTRRASLTTAFGNNAVSGQACIATAVQLAHNASKIVFTDCVEDLSPSVSTLPADSLRYVVAVPNLNGAVFNALGGGIAVNGPITGDAAFLIKKFASEVLLQISNGMLMLDLAS